MRFSIPMLLGLALLSLFGQSAQELVVLQPRFNRGRVVLPAKVNSTTQYFFMLDSACTIPTLHPEVVDELKLEPSGTVRIAGIAGEERAPTFRNVQFDFAGAIYAPRRVASIASERSESRRRRDGVIGSSFFQRFVVEIDPKNKEVRLHSSTNYNYEGPATIVPFTFRQEIPVMKGAIVLEGRDPIEGEFELDTGCDSGLCLGQSFVERHQLLEKAQNRKSEKFGVGGTVNTHDINVPELRFGDLHVKNVQTDCFLEGSPVDEPLAGHAGMGALKDFKVIVDYARKRLIVEK
jgi:hypothetical protein